MLLSVKENWWWRGDHSAAYPIKWCISLGKWIGVDHQCSSCSSCLLTAPCWAACVPKKSAFYYGMIIWLAEELPWKNLFHLCEGLPGDSIWKVIFYWNNTSLGIVWTLLLFICMVTQNVRSWVCSCTVLTAQHRRDPSRKIFFHIKMEELNRKCDSVVFLGHGRARGCGDGEGNWNLQLQPQTDWSATEQTRLKAQTCKSSGKLSSSPSVLTPHLSRVLHWMEHLLKVP